MATVVLGIAAAGVLLPFVSGAAVQAEGAHRTLAAKLASDLMEEFIRGASYEYDASQPFFIIVTVWVKYNGNEIVSLSRLISK